MKRILFITALFISIVSYSQRNGTAQEQIEAGKVLLSNEDPCNYTGILWIKSALKQEPNNIEANNLIKKCDNYKLNVEAKQLFKEVKYDLDNNYSSNILSKIKKIVKIDSLNEEALFLYGKLKTQKGFLNEGLKYLTKAIELNPKQPKYYWFRSQAEANKGLRNHELELGTEKAITDIDIMISLDAKSVKIFNRKAFLYQNLAEYYARKYEYFRPKVSEGWEDDGSQEADKKELFNKAIENYELAELNYKKALEISPEDAKIKSSIKSILINVNKLKTL